MRVAGWILLLAGFVLCLSVVWAALGFLLMGIGLVSLQVDERKRKRAKAATELAVDADPKLNAAPAIEAPPTVEEPVLAAPQPPPAAQSTDVATASYDKEAWQRLVEQDRDLAQLGAVLADYGQHHVDEFASSYLAAPDKSRLAAIVDGIIAKASKGNIAATTRDQPATGEKQKPESAQPKAEPNRDPPKPEPDAPSVQPAKTPIVRIVADEIRIETEPDQDGRTTSADDDLSELIRKFAPDANYHRR